MKGFLIMLFPTTSASIDADLHVQQRKVWKLRYHHRMFFGFRSDSDWYFARAKV